MEPLPDIQPPTVPPQQPRWSSGQMFFIGLVTGTAASGLIHMWIWHDPKSQSPDAAGALLCLIGAKLIVGLTALFLPRWRSLGIGVIASYATGFLIFFGLCAANLKNMQI